MKDILPSKGQKGFQKVLKTVNGERSCRICKTMKPINEFVLRGERGEYRGKCKECYNKITKDIWVSVRKKIFDHYGWFCRCCGETMPQFMSLDHVNNDGFLDKHPNGKKKSGKALYLLVLKQGFPDKYQTLCMNCNWGKKISGICPHKSVV